MITSTRFESYILVDGGTLFTIRFRALLQSFPKLQTLLHTAGSVGMWEGDQLHASYKGTEWNTSIVHKLYRGDVSEVKDLITLLYT